MTSLRCCLQIELCPDLVTLLRRQLHDLYRGMARLMPGARVGRQAVVQYFGEVLEHPAVCLLQHWQPEVVAQKRQTLSALRDEVATIVTESGRRQSQRVLPGSKAESDQELRGAASNLNFAETSCCSFRPSNRH